MDGWFGGGRKIYPIFLTVSGSDAIAVKVVKLRMQVGFLPKELLIDFMSPVHGGYELRIQGDFYQDSSPVIKDA